MIETLCIYSISANGRTPERWLVCHQLVQTSETDGLVLLSQLFKLGMIEYISIHWTDVAVKVFAWQCFKTVKKRQDGQSAIDIVIKSLLQGKIIFAIF